MEETWPLDVSVLPVSSILPLLFNNLFVLSFLTSINSWHPERLHSAPQMSL